MKRIWLTMIAAAMLTVAAVAPVAAQDTVTIDMKEVDDSGQSGSADITTDGEQVTVAIEIDAGEEGVPQPAHIHEGSCQELGDVAYPLNPVEDGQSESTADVSMSELLAGEYAINVHLSEDDLETHVACGTLPLIGGGQDEAADDEEEDAAEDEDGDEASDEGDEATEDDDEGAAEDDGEAAENGDDEAAEDDEDTAAEEDEEAGEDEEPAAEGDDDAAGEDDEEVDEVAPATGSLNDPGAGAAVSIMVLLASGALGAGLIVRRRASQA